MRNDNINDQQVQIAINTRQSSGGGASFPVLPYDPTTAPDDTNNVQILAPNFIDNSDFDFSKDGYLNNPTVGGDAAEECFNWFRQRFIKLTDVTTVAFDTNISSPSGLFKAGFSYPMDFVLLNGKSTGEALSGTLTRVDDNNATVSAAPEKTLTGAVLWFGDTLEETSGKSLKSSAHSLFAAGEDVNAEIPRWDKLNGWAETGAGADDRFDTACPLPLNIVRAGLTYFVRCIVSTRDGSVPTAPVRISAGIWDASTGQQRFLEGSNFALSATVVGTPGATLYKYKVIADLDDGRTIESDTITVAAGNAVLSGANYIRLTWTNAAGILNFRIYRESGGVVKRIFTIRNGARDYNDYGTDEGETSGAFPTAPVVRPIAYGLSPAFRLAGENIWQAVLIEIQIPSTYNAGQTTGKQWLRIGVENAPGDARCVLIDRVLFSTSNGGWQRSARDLNKILNQNPTSNPPSSTQGNTGLGNNCFTLDTPVVVCSPEGKNFRAVPIGQIEKGMFVFSGGTRVNRIIDIIDGTAGKLITCRLSSGVEFRCTPSERFFTSRADRRGTRIDELTIGDEILCWIEGRAQKATIEEYKIVETEAVAVRTLCLSRGNRAFIAGVLPDGRLGGAIAHNRKDPNDFDLPFPNF